MLHEPTSCARTGKIEEQKKVDTIEAEEMNHMEQYLFTVVCNHMPEGMTPTFTAHEWPCLYPC